MALLIKTSGNNHYEYYVGAKECKHVNRDVYISLDEAAGYTAEIILDGAELTHAREMFLYARNWAGYVRSTVIPQGQTVRLFGDLAKTIVANFLNEFDE